MNQKKALRVTLIIFIVAFIQTQLIWFGYSPLFNGLGGLVIIGGLTVLTFVILVIQLIAYLASRNRSGKP